MLNVILAKMKTYNCIKTWWSLIYHYSCVEKKGQPLHNRVRIFWTSILMFNLSEKMNHVFESNWQDVYLPGRYSRKTPGILRSHSLLDSHISHFSNTPTTLRTMSITYCKKFLPPLFLHQHFALVQIFKGWTHYVIYTEYKHVHLFRFIRRKFYTNCELKYFRRDSRNNTYQFATISTLSRPHSTAICPIYYVLTPHRILTSLDCNALKPMAVDCEGWCSNGLQTSSLNPDLYGRINSVFKKIISLD